MAQKAGEGVAVRPFRVDVPEEELVDLRRRIAATQWPEKETVADESQGVRLATMQELARYWATDYDWRKCEAKLKALPQFITEIDGLDIHFIHVRSKHDDALPLIVTHGWPGSIIEQLKIVGPLTDPTAHGGSAEDAFDVVIPSMPGYRTGRDVFKALALGADAVLIGRPYLYGLALDGQAGTTTVMQKLVDELRREVRNARRRSHRTLSRSSLTRV